MLRKVVAWMMQGILGVAGVSAGPIFSEQGDAPDTLPGQATGSGPLTAITGTIDSATDVDIFTIRIVDPNWYATTTGNSTTIDTRLWLFSLDGMGQTFNDDDPTQPFQSSIGPGHDPPGGEWVAVGQVYGLAIGAYQIEPRDAADQALWNATPFTAERAPDGPGAANPLDHWGFSGFDTGAYQIDLFGIEAVPEPSTLALLSLALLAVRRR